MWQTYSTRRGILRALDHRHRLIAVAAGLFAAVFAASVFLESPGLGIGHFFYVPIVLLAVAGGPRLGALAGLVATVLFALATLGGEELTLLEAAIRLSTYLSIGAFVGLFATNNRVLVERLREEATQDFLTGLLNLRGFESAFERRCRAMRPFALFLGDMDGLKEINDREGHFRGNEALERVAQMLREAVRREDDVARVGGDEFAVLIALDDMAAAGVFSEQLEQRLSARGVQVSFGWALFPTEGPNADALFQCADRRLYERKLLRSDDGDGEHPAARSQAEELANALRCR